MLSPVLAVASFSDVFLARWLMEGFPWTGSRRVLNESLRKMFSMENDKNGFTGGSRWVLWLWSWLMFLVADILAFCGQFRLEPNPDHLSQLLCWPSYISSLAEHKAGFCFSMFTHAYFQKRLNSSFIMESLIKLLTAHVKSIRSFDKSSFLSNISPVSESSLGAY